MKQMQPAPLLRLDQFSRRLDLVLIAGVQVPRIVVTVRVVDPSGEGRSLRLQ